MNDAVSSLTIAVRIVRLRHCGIGGGIIEQALGFPKNCVSIRTRQTYSARIDRFGALGGVTGHEDGLAQAGRFFLNAARIRDNQVRAIHQPDERQVIERRDQVHIINPLQDRSRRLLDFGVQVNRIHNLDITA